MTDIIDNIADNLINEIPEVQEHAIENRDKDKPEYTETPSATVSDGPRDKDGNSFNPNIHMTDKDGNPTITPKTGKLRMKRKSRKPSGTSGSVAGIDEPINQQNPRMAATATVESIGMLARMVGGEEFAFIRNVEHGIDERASGIDAFTSYFETKGVTDIPPGVALAIWAISYAGPRFAMPKTKSRLALASAWVKNKLSRNKKVSDDGKHSDTRDM